MFCSTLSCSISTTRITSIQSCKCFGIERTFKNLLGSLQTPESDNDKLLVDFFIVDPVVSFSEPLIARYTKENLQNFFIIDPKAQVFFFNRPCEKLLKAMSFDIYCDKFHMECYNFY